MAALARIVPFLRGFRLKLALMFGLALLGVGLSTLYPLVGRYLVDQVLVPRNQAGLVPALGALVGLALIGWLLRGVGRTLNALTTAEILIAMRTHLFSHLLRLPQSFFVRSRTGDLVARLHQDLTEAQRVATDAAPGLLAAALSALASLGMLIYLDWRLTLATLSVTPLMLLAVSALRPPLRRDRSTRKGLSCAVSARCSSSSAADICRTLTRWPKRNTCACRVRSCVRKLMFPDPC